MASLRRPTSLAVLALALVASATAYAEDEPAGSGGSVAPPSSYGDVPDFALVERSGRAVKRADLLGKTWIAAFVFTRCAGPCPKISAQCAKLARDLAGRDVTLVTITVDPTHDTPKVLDDYAKSFGAGDRWLFLTGAQADVERLVRDGFHLGIVGSGTTITHSTRLALVDRDARIVGYFDGEDDAAVEELRARAASLAPSPIVAELPAVNAGLNATCAVLLVVGLVAIKRRRVGLHKTCMLAALVVSAVFLACYLYYHVHHGATKFPGAGAARVGYLALLASHVVLAAVSTPLAIATATFGLRGKLDRHVRLAKITFPIWLYVSVTGVAVYLILYQIYGCVA